MTTILQRTPIQVVFGPCWSVGDHQELSLAANEVPRGRHREWAASLALRGQAETERRLGVAKLLSGGVG